MTLTTAAPDSAAMTANEAINAALEAAHAAGNAALSSEALVALIYLDQTLPLSALNAARSLKGSAYHAGQCFFARAYALDPDGLTARATALRAKLSRITEGEGAEAARAHAKPAMRQALYCALLCYAW